MMNLSLNDESRELILCGVQPLCKGKLMNVPQVIFNYNFWWGVPAPIVDVGYEME